MVEREGKNRDTPEADGADTKETAGERRREIREGEKDRDAGRYARGI